VKLKILVPTEVHLEVEAASIVAEGGNGSFCLRPRHADFVSTIVPGLLSYTAEGETSESFAAVDRGTIVKYGEEVLVSVRSAVSGVGVEELLRLVHTQFLAVDDQERSVRTAVARLESDFLRRFMELK
jgi:F-type H+-transporting ATPase subunit epsilon